MKKEKSKKIKGFLIKSYVKEEKDSILLKSPDKFRASSRGKTKGASVIHK
jgi:hypothetical protein